MGSLPPSKTQQPSNGRAVRGLQSGAAEGEGRWGLSHSSGRWKIRIERSDKWRSRGGQSAGSERGEWNVETPPAFPPASPACSSPSCCCLWCSRSRRGWGTTTSAPSVPIQAGGRLRGGSIQRRAAGEPRGRRSKDSLWISPPLLYTHAPSLPPCVPPPPSLPPSLLWFRVSRHVREYGGAEAPGHDQPVRGGRGLRGGSGEAAAASGTLAVRDCFERIFSRN